MSLRFLYNSPLIILAKFMTSLVARKYRKHFKVSYRSLCQKVMRKRHFFYPLFIDFSVEKQPFFRANAMLLAFKSMTVGCQSDTYCSVNSML